MELMLKLLPFFLIAVLLSIIFTYLPVKRYLVYKLGISGDITTSCCKEEVVASSSGDFDEGVNLAIFDGQIIDYPKTSLARDNSTSSETSAVLGTTNAVGKEKRIEVSLKDQKLRAWEGDELIMEFPISSGLWTPTPKGEFNIWYKTRYQRMTGGSQELGTYYDLPNVPNNMFFHKGFAIHGAYWHNNFGKPMSHGCVNSPLSQVSQLFEWSGPSIPPGKNAVRASAENPGTRVIIN